MLGGAGFLPSTLGRTKAGCCLVGKPGEFRRILSVNMGLLIQRMISWWFWILGIPLGIPIPCKRGSNPNHQAPNPEKYKPLVPMTDPWHDWIFTYMYHKNQPNVGIPWKSKDH